MNPSITELVSLKGKVAIVTGAAMGIGLAIAKRLSEAGASVVLFDLHYDAVHQAANNLDSIGDSVAAYHGDASNEENVKSAVDFTVERFGKVDILVNNAGIFPNTELSQMRLADFERVLEVNLKSVFLFTKYASNHMKGRGEGGRILNITSIDAIHPSMTGLAHYDASKHGVWGFTKNVAIELARDRIWVNALAPGGIATPGVAALQTSTGAVDPQIMKDRIEQFLSTIPMHRMGEPDDIARMALVMCSDLSSYMTGSQVVVDGGVLLS